jgi:Ca-activated chloride channel family protein
MKRLLLCSLLAACVAALGAQQEQPQGVFRTGTDLVRVFVTVTDRDGRLVTTLTQKDFEVRDSGKAQPIVLFDNSPVPIRLIVMLDVSGSMEGNLPLLRAGAEELFKRLGPDDAAKVGTFGNSVTISPTFTRDPAELRAALPTTIEDAPTPLWRAVDDAMNAFDKEGSERRVVLVLSDGKDSGPAFAKRWVSQVEVIDRARASDTMLYAIGLQSRGQRLPPGLGPGSLSQALTADLPDPGLGEVAIQSGGAYAELRGGQSLGAAFAQIADELHSQYLIGYDPPKRDGKVHEIDVRLADRGLKPRARKSYVAPKAAP